eukprot:XP_011682855.1 PREDICTED: pre-mRNA-splicing factor cwc-21-like [Strongylocentrotus purpuratus]
MDRDDRRRKIRHKGRRIRRTGGPRGHAVEDSRPGPQAEQVRGPAPARRGAREEAEGPGRRGGGGAAGDRTHDVRQEGRGTGAHQPAEQSEIRCPGSDGMRVKPPKLQGGVDQRGGRDEDVETRWAEGRDRKEGAGSPEQMGAQWHLG